MDLVPTHVNGAVVINLVESCGGNLVGCGACTDLSVAIHNMLLTSELGYVILDMQDEKVVCPGLLEEVLQLWKRMRCPFFFVGVMQKPQAVLESYSYSSFSSVFATPDEAISMLKEKYPELYKAEITGIVFDRPLVANRSRVAREEEVEEEAD